VGLKSLKSLNLTNVYPNNNKDSNSNNKVKSKPLKLYELAGNKNENREITKKVLLLEKVFGSCPDPCSEHFGVTT
jgi:hypothetical protein